MGIGLTNARLAGGAIHIQKITPARTSIAEDAIFIPKPRKRVDFKISDSSKMAVANLPGSGQAIGSPDIGGNLKMGSLGKDGLTASFTKESYSSRANHVDIEYDRNPEKDYDVIAPQEEGRQTNNAHTTHYSQQYDAYGRPRIGFSREPYDFAATKYIYKTSEIRLMENVESSRAAYAYADMRNQAKNTAENSKADLSPMTKKMPGSSTVEGGNSESYTPMVQPQYEKGTLGETPVPLPGSKDTSLSEEMKPLNYDKLPGEKRPEETEAEKAPIKPAPEPAVMTPRNIAETAGLNFKEILTPANNGPASKAHDVLPEKTNKHLSITA
jgi:hypothetical protein